MDARPLFIFYGDRLGGVTTKKLLFSALHMNVRSKRNKIHKKRYKIENTMHKNKEEKNMTLST
jgi:hypothetical protein